MSSDLSGLINNRTHHFKVRVYYEDTDFTGIVYHANYLKFAERARTNFLRLLNVNHSMLIESDDPVYFVVYKMNSKFLGTAKIDDLLEVRSNKLIYLDGSSFESKFKFELKFSNYQGILYIIY